MTGLVSQKRFCNVSCRILGVSQGMLASLCSCNMCTANCTATCAPTCPTTAPYMQQAAPCGVVNNFIP